MDAAADPPRRCEWASGPELIAYHDEEWGVPVHGDRPLFEFLVLECAQAGLSWSTILKKRSAYREAFAGFDPETVAAFSHADQQRLLGDPGIVRNRLKVAAAVENARALLSVRGEFGSFDEFIWSFVQGRPRKNRWRFLSDLPSQTEESRSMSRELRRRGFRFVGPTICYAFMQATGMVNDHVVSCFRYDEI